METNFNKAFDELFSKARVVGEVNPQNPNLVWTEYAPGKFDWRKSNHKAKRVEEVTLDTLKNAVGHSSFMQDRSIIKIDGEEYYKERDNRWMNNPSNPHMMPREYTDQKMFDMIQTAKRASKNVDTTGIIHKQ